MATTLERSPRKRGQRCCAIEPKIGLNEAEVQRLTADFQILAHPIRLHILDLLASSEEQVCVCDLEAALPIKQPTVSHHLKLLREAGLIDVERHGLWAYYRLRRGALAELRERVANHLHRLA